MKNLTIAREADILKIYQFDVYGDSYNIDNFYIEFVGDRVAIDVYRFYICNDLLREKFYFFQYHCPSVDKILVVLSHFDLDALITYYNRKMSLIESVEEYLSRCKGEGD